MGGRSEDRSGAEACIEQILRDPGLRVPGAGQPADVLSLQELQRCSRQVKQGDCHHCARGAGACRNDHAGWVASELARHGYDGAVHEHGMTNTVGSDAKVLNCTFVNNVGILSQFIAASQ